MCVKNMQKINLCSATSLVTVICQLSIGQPVSLILLKENYWGQLAGADKTEVGSSIAAAGNVGTE